jgi:hypothetical protein
MHFLGGKCIAMSAFSTEMQMKFLTFSLFVQKIIWITQKAFGFIQIDPNLVLSPQVPHLCNPQW